MKMLMRLLSSETSNNFIRLHIYILYSLKYSFSLQTFCFLDIGSSGNIAYVVYFVLISYLIPSANNCLRTRWFTFFSRMISFHSLTWRLFFSFLICCIYWKLKQFTRQFQFVILQRSWTFASEVGVYTVHMTCLWALISLFKS